MEIRNVTRVVVVAMVVTVTVMTSCSGNDATTAAANPPAAARSDSKLGTPDLPPLQFDPVADDPTTVGAEVNAEALFAIGSATLSPQAESVVQGIKARLDQGPSFVRIDGFTDGLGDNASNKDLSKRRAQALADRVIALGSAKAVVACGNGEAGTDGTSADPTQRRVVVLISSKPVNDQCP